MKTHLVLALALVAPAVFAQTVEYVNPPIPFSSSPAFGRDAAPVTSGIKKLPILTWGPDAHILSANNGFKANANSKLAKALGTPVEIVVMDDIETQVRSILGGQPFFRGTVGQLALANEGLRAKGVEMVAIYQVSFSTGADGFVFGAGINSFADLKGKVVVTQANGPHLDFMFMALADANLSPGDVVLKYVRDITNTERKVAKATDPANALRNDKTIAGAAMIGPDIAVITAGGVGTGQEDSVRGARAGITTKTAPGIIADVIAVRRDYLEAHEAEVKAFVRTLLESATHYQKNLENISKKGAADRAMVTAFRAEMEPWAETFLGDKTLVNDLILWVGVDAKLAGVSGNAEFFQQANNPIGYDAINAKIRGIFAQAGYLKSQAVTMAKASWDWTNLGVAAVTSVKKQTFTSEAATRAAADTKDATEIFKWTFQFPAAESDINWKNYESVFDTLHEKVKRYGGAIIQIRGHSDPFLYNFLKMKLNSGATTYSIGGQVKPIPPLESIEANATQLSFSRAHSVKTAYLEYLREKLGVNREDVNLSRFDLRGMGFKQPLFANPSGDKEQLKKQRESNMRCELVIISAESELPSDFDADDLK